MEALNKEFSLSENGLDQMIEELSMREEMGCKNVTPAVCNVNPPYAH